MAAEDPGDVFLRHRGAVLDALLSDPSFGENDPATGSVLSGPLVGDPEFGEAEFGGDPYSAPSVAAGSAQGGLSDTDLPPRRSSDGPKASERIIALLNGQPPNAAPALDFSSDYSDVSAKPPPPEEPARAASGASKARGPEPAERIVLLAKKLKNPKVALAVCGVLALLLIIALVSTGGKDDSQAPDRIAVITPSPTAAAPTSKPESSTAPSGTITPKSATANCPPGSTPGMDAFGGQGKAWSCVRAYKVDGQVLTIDLGKTYQIDSIGIVPGWDNTGSDGVDQWTKFRTASRVRYTFDDPNKTSYTQTTLDQRTLVVTKFEVPVQASKIVLTVQESKGDPTINTTAISSIVITGH
ncbi:discoidin domain-containing protein [Nocardia sp. NPDC049526]|uniref:discoidin domain-containing protein n=1 Tax=Nocardia sp. NPDC049526 TaxID=3364316 RepID=UPI00378F998C